MGFMDKAKKMAEQAQAKIDEAQKQFNSGQQRTRVPARRSSTTPTAGRSRRRRRRTPAPPHGDPLGAESQSTPPPPARPPTPGVPPTAHRTPRRPDAPPAQPQADAADEDRNRPSYAPPKLTERRPARRLTER